MYFNGALEPEFKVDLISSLPPGEVFVLWHEEGTDLAPYVSALPYNQPSGFGWFNGDDAVLLVSGTTVVDSFGTVGVRPDGTWGKEVRTKDRTLRWAADVSSGDENPTDLFDPVVEWLEVDKDTFSGLGVR